MNEQWILTDYCWSYNLSIHVGCHMNEAAKQKDWLVLTAG